MTAYEHAARAAEILNHVEAAGRHPGRAALPRFPNQPLLIETSLLLATAHALTAQALVASKHEAEV